MSNTLPTIRFEIDELDRAIDEVNVQSDLSIEGRRVLAARSMTAFSMALAIGDEDQYFVALRDLGDIPEDGEELKYLSDFSRALALDLHEAIGETSPVSPIFTRRVNAYIDSVNSFCQL